VKDGLAVVGLLTLVYFGLCWVARVHPAEVRLALALCAEQVAALLRGGN
jgi:hypothetical protein